MGIGVCPGSRGGCFASLLVLVSLGTSRYQEGAGVSPSGRAAAREALWFGRVPVGVALGLLLRVLSNFSLS